jgi:hypothetical protein
VTFLPYTSCKISGHFKFSCALADLKYYRDERKEFECLSGFKSLLFILQRGVDNSLARPGRKQATETEDFDVQLSYL